MFFSNILGFNFLAVLEAEHYLLDGYLNGQAADIVPDTGSDIMVLSLLFAKQLGLTVHNGPEHRIKVQFIDGSEAYTIGRVRGVKWRFQRYLDWGKHTLRRDGYEFHIIQNLPVDVIVSNDFIAKVGVGMYGIRYIESKRAHKKEQMSCGQSSSAETEESELHRRDAAEEDIEELLLTDPVAAESRRLEEQERRRAQDRHKRRYDEVRLASIPQTATINTGRIALPAQHSSTDFSLHNTSLTRQSAHVLYQSQAGAATAASFDKAGFISRNPGSN
ncbi:hypothetical protein INS49_014780 [Diaporthe citri]|uniref:uncharacterized protein n=1 Tax=Diaporthe citri TaxID=83186 RepID=UPI001C7EEB73|nr:uncharacterized protein INS49_014780 [Diaporthe citri]KAG6356905.1 hypothetical protein INS49_014780 [Diaporthe citri]